MATLKSISALVLGLGAAAAGAYWYMTSESGATPDEASNMQPISSPRVVPERPEPEPSRVETEPITAPQGSSESQSKPTPAQGDEAAALGRKSSPSKSDKEVEKLVQNLAQGLQLDSIADDNLRNLIAAKLQETDDKFNVAKERFNETKKRAIDDKIAAGKYEITEPGKSFSDNGAIINAMRGAADGKSMHVLVFKGDAPDFEQAMEDLRLLRKRREADVRQLLQNAGMSTSR